MHHGSWLISLPLISILAVMRINSIEEKSAIQNMTRLINSNKKKSEERCYNCHRMDTVSDAKVIVNDRPVT